MVSYTPPMGPNGVIPTGLSTRDIADGSCLYVPADTPDGRIGFLTIGQSPAGWRRPYHGTITNGLQDGSGEKET